MAQRMPGGGVIAFDEAGYGYGGEALLSGMTLSLGPGSFHFLTGPSGAGKTTMIRLCTAALRPTAGRIEIFGRDVAALDRDGVALLRRRIGVVHQDCQFVDHLPVAENVALPIVVAGQEPVAAEIADRLDWVGLGALARSLPPALSGGERQRAAIARAIIAGPEVILADEPTGNVDWEMSLRILRLLAELNRLGKTVLIATHDLNLIRAARGLVTARVLRIQQGRIVQAGTDL
jgi:cell division transport system ATP-binding protein